MLLLLFGVLFSCIALGVPIAFSLIISGAIPMYINGTFNYMLVAQKVIDASDNYALMAAPCFILAGELMNRAGITRRLIDFIMSLVGHFRGGLGYVAIVTTLIFAGLSGSAVADAAAIGTALIPSMVAYGYDKKISTGLIMSSAVVGPVIPPSVVFIVFGVVTGVSIIQLFMAGIVPGVMISGGIAIVWTIIARKTNVQRMEKKRTREVLKLGMSASWSLVLPIIIIGGLRLGFFTPTEASVVAVFYTLFIGTVVYRELKLKDIYDALLSAMLTSSALMFVIGASGVTAWFITTGHVTEGLVAFFVSIQSPTLIMIMIVCLLLLCGCILDATPVILIFAPVFMPVITELGIDPVYFGLVFSTAIILGFLTPPVGLGIFTGMRLANLSLGEMVEGIAPFLLVIIITMFVITIFPSTILVPLGFFF